MQIDASIHTSGNQQAKRTFDSLVGKFNLSLRIKASEYTHIHGSSSVVLPYLKPSDVLTCLLCKWPWLLFGGSELKEPLLLAFWDAYKLEHPAHEVFNESRERLSRTFPITVHGDGGRTQKRQPLEIFSMQPVIGLDTLACKKMAMKCSCIASAKCGCGHVSDPGLQRLNSKHSSFLTHFLVFAYPSKAYSKDFPNLLTGLLECVCDDLATACKDGLSINGKTLYPACIGFKLDMEWMVKVGALTRSYQNVGIVRPIPCCSECEAGSPGTPFEDVNIGARWVGTRFQTVPWNVPPPWRNIPFDNGQPAKFLRRDAFHIFRLGIGRNFAGSTIYLLVFMGCYLAINYFDQVSFFNFFCACACRCVCIYVCSMCVCMSCVVLPCEASHLLERVGQFHFALSALGEA